VRPQVSTPAQGGTPATRQKVVRPPRDTETPHGEGTVGKELAELTRAGLLVNPRDKRGYRLPEWPRRPRTRSLF
jgi:hypothetical protein